MCKYNVGSRIYSRSLEITKELSDPHLGDSEEEENNGEEMQREKSDEEEVPYR